MSPGDQDRDWRQRWEQIQREQNELCAGQPGTLGSNVVHAARERLLSFYVRAYHLKDALKLESGVDPDVIENAITADPDLSLLADLANLDKHGKLSKPPRSPHVPKVGRVSSAPGAGGGWRLHLEIEHGSARKDGLECAARAVAAWHALLTAWGLA